MSPPLPTDLKVKKDDDSNFDAKNANMAKLVYSLSITIHMYAMIAMRLDITFVVRVISMFTSNPSKRH